MDWNRIFYETDLSEEFIREHIHNIQYISCLFKGENLRKGRIYLPSSEELNECFDEFMDVLYSISADSMVDDRRYNENIWKEYEVYEKRSYVIETFFTEKEITRLEEKYPGRLELL